MNKNNIRRRPCQIKPIFYALVAVELLARTPIKRQADSEHVTPSQFAIAVYLLAVARYNKHFVEVGEAAWLAGKQQINKALRREGLYNEEQQGKEFGKAVKRKGQIGFETARLRAVYGEGYRFNNKRKLQPLGVVEIDISDYELMSQLGLNRQRYRAIVRDALERLAEPIGEHPAVIASREGERLAVEDYVHKNFRKVPFHLPRGVQALRLFMWLLVIRPDCKKPHPRKGIHKSDLAHILGVRLDKLKQELGETVDQLNEHYLPSVKNPVRIACELPQKYAYKVGLDKVVFWQIFPTAPVKKRQALLVPQSNVVPDPIVDKPIVRLRRDPRIVKEINDRRMMQEDRARLQRMWQQRSERAKND